MKGDPCKRVKTVIDGENFYLLIGMNFVDCTVPFENRPENVKLRTIVDTICRTITEAQGGFDE
jgi:hypothetical protein